ncbi:hypothetical protein VTJ49DRAFT_5173 [Mycothermus thermophilus]|uniref:Uncharacterized protein n=1 Tax=Humicola insolens TaxID=85995 RepID=A0ABR3V3R7_HUMIN
MDDRQSLLRSCDSPTAQHRRTQHWGREEQLMKVIYHPFTTDLRRSELEPLTVLHPTLDLLFPARLLASPLARAEPRLQDPLVDAQESLHCSTTLQPHPCKPRRSEASPSLTHSVSFSLRPRSACVLEAPSRSVHLSSSQMAGVFDIRLWSDRTTPRP